MLNENRRAEIIRTILSWGPDERKQKIDELEPGEQDEYLRVLDSIEELKDSNTDRVRKIRKRELEEMIKEELSEIMGNLLTSTLYEVKEPKKNTMRMTYKELKQLINEEVIAWKEKNKGGGSSSPTRKVSPPEIESPVMLCQVRSK